MFLAVDSAGNEIVVKVDSWEDGERDPSAPEDQYAAVEAYLASLGITATVTDHAIKAGSYNGNSGGGVFLSDGSLVDEDDIEDYWFADAWSGNAFNDPDHEVDFDQLPDTSGSGGKPGSNDEKDGDVVDDSTDGDQLPEGDPETLDSLAGLAPDEAEFGFLEPTEETAEDHDDGVTDDSGSADIQVAASSDDALNVGDLLFDDDDELSKLIDGQSPSVEPPLDIDLPQEGDVDDIGSLDLNLGVDHGALDTGNDDLD